MYCLPVELAQVLTIAGFKAHAGFNHIQIDNSIRVACSLYVCSHFCSPTCALNAMYSASVLLAYFSQNFLSDGGMYRVTL